jgi:hypothetical protein
MQVLGEICENLSLSQQISDDDLERVKRNFLNLQTETITALMDAFEITWQKTCSRRQLEIVKKLLLDEMTSRGQMENDAYCQSLALDIAAGNGNLTRVKQLCEPHLNQPLARNNSVRYGLAIPVVRASNAGHKKVTDYLYYNHYKRTLPLVLENDNDVYWATCLLLDAIFYGFLDIALDIIKHLPSVAVTKHARQRLPIYKFIAVKPDLFRSHCNFGFWRHLIYSCIRVSENPRPKPRQSYATHIHSYNLDFFS